MRATRLRHVARLNPSVPEFVRADPGEMVTFIPLAAVWPDGLDCARERPKAEVESGYTRFREGDILIPKITPTFQADRSTIARGLRNGFGCGTTELHVLRPGPQLDVRFANYVISSRPFLQGGAAEMIGVAGQKRVPEQFVLDFVLPDLPINEQRSIADFLDRETSRIDGVVDRRNALVALLVARRKVLVEATIRAEVDRYGSQPLRHSSRIEVGIVVTPANWYAPAGTTAIRGVNVKPGRVVLDDVVHLSEDGHRLHRKSMLRGGDIVVVRTGQAGAAAVVPPALDGCNCIDLLIVRPAATMDPYFLEFVLNSDWTQKHIDMHSVGTIQSHFNVGAMKQLPVPVPPLDVQAQIVQRLRSVTERIDRTIERMHRQIALLQEHRRALITAAVTGELEVAA